MKQSDPGHILFDLDGTLVDSAADLTRAINHVMLEEGRRALSVAEIIDMVGDGAPKLVKRALAATGGLPDPEHADRIRARFLDYYGSALAIDTCPFPGVPDTLATLAAEGWRFAVCTNKPTGPAKQLLAELGLADRFICVIGGDAVRARKPDPAHVHAVLDEMGDVNGRTVMVGDSAHDIDAARGAGIGAIVVSYGYAHGDVHGFGADAVIDHFAELPAVLDRLA